MNKLIAVEIGSTNTKAYLYDGQIHDLGVMTIEFKKHYIDQGKIITEDKEALYTLLSDLKQITANIHVYGTSIFRNLSDLEKEEWLSEFEQQMHLPFTIVSSKQESDYTVKGVLANMDYDGRLAIMIGGGGSTEVAIVEYKQVMEQVNSNFGAIDLVNQFPDLMEDIVTTNYETLLESTINQFEKFSHQADVLILAGGDFIKFYATMEYPLQSNFLYEDENQPYLLEREVMEQYDYHFFYDRSFQSVLDSVEEKGWWRGVKGMRLCSSALADLLDTKYIIPTRINMLFGIIAELLDQQTNE